MIVRFQYTDIYEFTDFLHKLQKHYYISFITAPIKKFTRNEVTIHFEAK